MIQNVRFTCSTLTGSGKAGILPKDEFGYYTQPIGGLNCFNSAGEYYPYQAAKQLFEQSSSFMRRVSTGCLKSEEGHPKPPPGFNPRDEKQMDSFANRVMSIDEKNVCAHIAEVYLDFDNVKDRTGKPIIAIMGKIKPAGPHGMALEESYNNPKEEVCFSIRAFTRDTRVAGINQRCLVDVVTFDRVTEPGIATSRKYFSPALECLSEARFTKDNVLNALKPIEGMAMESGGIIMPTDLFKVMGWDTDLLQEPKYLKW